MQTDLLNKLNLRYERFMKDLEISNNGVLGKITNPRYKDHKLRFSGFPYIGSKYFIAKKRILFVGLDIGIDELREKDKFHDFDSRRDCIAGSVEGCTSLGYNDHISGTYTMALFLLKDFYSWNEEWNKILSFKDNTSKSIINSLTENLPIEVLDYIAFTNIHKFVSKCRGCDLEAKRKPDCWSLKCEDGKKNINRSGGDNRKWYNGPEEIEMLLDEIKILKPDLLYFQGSARGLKTEILNEINSFCDICEAYHPSAWNVKANKPGYASKVSILPKK